MKKSYLSFASNLKNLKTTNSKNDINLTVNSQKINELYKLKDQKSKLLKEIEDKQTLFNDLHINPKAKQILKKINKEIENPKPHYKMMKPLNARTTSILKDNRTSANKVNGGSDSLEKENFLPIHKLKLLKRIKVFLIDALQFENLPRLFIENVEIVSTEYSPNGKYINVFWRPLDSKLEKEILKKLEEVAVDLEKVLQRLLVLRMGKGGIKVPTIPSLKFKRDYSDKEEIENIMNKIEIEIKNLKI